MNVQIPVKWLQELLALCGPEDHELRERVMVSITAMDEQAARAVAVPDGWREKFAADVYADLAAADNQDVPLEEYPARILKVLDSIVGPRHPVVIKWRNDAIRNCIAVAYKYCRDPESHKYLKQDLEAMLTTEPAPQAPADALATATGLPAQADPVAWRIASRATPGRYITFDEHPGPAYPNAQPLYAAPQQADARDAESDYQRGYRHGYNRRDAEVLGALL